MELEFGLLGPLTVTVDGQPVVVRASKQRVLLAVLLIRAGSTVSAQALIDAIWGDRPPATVRNTLQVYVGRLRQTLGSEEIIRTRVGGYAIDVAPASIDAGRFTEFLATARAADADLTAEFDQLSAALSLWRGPFLVDVDDTAPLREYGAALQEERLAATERRFDVGLALGRHAELVSELVAATAEHPLRERLWCQRMLALYRCGRQAEALAAYQTVSRLLGDELGLDPGEELRNTQQSILRNEPAQQTRQVPAQLPAEPTGFAGRTEELAALDDLLLGDVSVAVLGGAGGIGKTALAVHWSRRVLDQFPGGQLYVDLCGYDRQQEPVTPQHALDGLLRALGVTGERMPADPGERAALYRSLVHGRRMLILLDNARSSAQVRPLLPGSGPSRVLVTSRDRLDGLVASEGARALAVPTLDSGAAVALLAGLLPDGRVAADTAAAVRLVRRCDGLPLALRIAAARLITNPYQSVAEFADELQDESGRLSALSLEAGELSVRATLDLSYRALPPEAARLLRLIGVQPGREISTSAAAALCGTTTRAIAAQLETLGQAHLLNRTGSDRFGLHDLVRAYAAARSASDDAAEDRELALRRIVDWYLLAAFLTNNRLNPSGLHRRPDIEHLPPDPPSFPDFDSALRWLEQEQDTLATVIAFCGERGWHKVCWQLAAKVVVFFDSNGSWAAAELLSTIGLASARAIGDAAAECTLLALAGSVVWERDNLAAAADITSEALTIATRLGDSRMISRLEGTLGGIYQDQRRWDEASQLLRRAADRSRADGELIPAMYHELNLTESLRQRGRGDEAALLLTDLVELASSLQDPYAMGSAHRQLARIALARGNIDEAIRLAEVALVNTRTLRLARAEAETLTTLGDCQLYRDRALALNYWRLALDIYERGAHPDAERLRARIADPPASLADAAAAW